MATVMAERRSTPWTPIMMGILASAILAGTVGWWVSLQSLEQQIQETRSGFKKLTVSGGIPPNQEVMDYLTSREAALTQRYHHWVDVVASPPPAAAASADPQLYFQEQLHDLQRSLERLAAAHAMTVPEQLGFPKELPPSDTVPRLLVQLALMRDAATLVVEQGVTTLTSLKIEDPETVPEDGGTTAWLLRLPVRVRLTTSLPQLMKILGAVERATPLIDVQGIRLVNAESTETERLEVELVLARYLVLTPPQDSTTSEEGERLPTKSRMSDPAASRSRQNSRTTTTTPTTNSRP